MTLRRLHFRPALTVFSLAALAVLVALGTWQLKRLEWKRALMAQIEARIGAEPISFEEALVRARAGEEMEYTPVRLSGAFCLAMEERVFGAYDGEAGAYVFAPLKTASGGYIYVNRGFTSQDAALAAPARNAEAIENVEGYFRYAERPTPPASWFRPQEKSADGFWFVRDPEKFAAAAGLAAPGYYIDQFAVEGRPRPKGGATRLEFPNRHLEYALTWFGLGAALIGIWVTFSLQKPNSSNNFEK